MNKAAAFGADTIARKNNIVADDIANYRAYFVQQFCFTDLTATNNAAQSTL